MKSKRPQSASKGMWIIVNPGRPKLKANIIAWISCTKPGLFWRHHVTYKYILHSLLYLLIHIYIYLWLKPMELCFLKFTFVRSMDFCWGHRGGGSSTPWRNEEEGSACLVRGDGLSCGAIRSISHHWNRGSKWAVTKTLLVSSASIRLL